MQERKEDIEYAFKEIQREEIFRKPAISPRAHYISDT
jgi:hypothetical protein